MPLATPSPVVAYSRHVVHSYALHSAVIAECLCCRSQQPFTFASTSDQVVCALCVHHLGAPKAERRDLDHIALWSRQYSAEVASHDTDTADAASAALTALTMITDLTARVAELTAVIGSGFTHSPTSDVRTLLESDVIHRAERNTELANRRIDRLMAVLWRIERLHRDGDKPGVCSCGKPIAQCAEYAAIEPERSALRTWESKNLALLRSGERHALPADHPDVAAAAGGGADPRGSRRR